VEKESNLEKMVNRSNKILHDDLKYIHNNIKKNYFKNKRILLIGSEGFIGFYLKNYFTNYFKDLKLKTLFLTDIKITKKKKIDNKIYQLKFDIIKDKIEKIDNKFDIIIHAASIASPVYYRKYPLETIDSNVTGIRKVLDYSKKNNSKVKILYFSTSEIYGDPVYDQIPTPETYRGNVSCIGPRACYDESKRLAETLCYIYSEYFKVPVIVVRPFNNYGPGLNIKDGRLPADLAKSILSNKNMKIFSDGKPTRSFCYISDAIIGFLKAITYPKYNVFNIGNNAGEISVKKLAIIYKNVGKKLFNYNSSIEFKKNKDKNYLVDNPNRRLPNIKKSKILLNFKPKIDVKSGVRKYLMYLKDQTK